MGTGKDTDSKDIHVFLHRRQHHLFGGAVQTGVNYVHAGVAQTTRDDLDAPVMAVETHLGNQHPYWPHSWAHAPSPINCRARSAKALGKGAARRASRSRCTPI